MRFLLSFFLAIFVFLSDSLIASQKGQKEICDGNLCIELKTALKEQNFILVDNLYEKLLISFEEGNSISYVGWSTMIDLTKSYAQICIKQGYVDRIFSVINRLLQKNPPEIFYQQLFVLKESLNPNKLSLGNFLRGLEQIQKKNIDLFLDSQDLLFFNACKYFVIDYFDSLRQRANKALFMGNYDQALDLYKQLIDGIKQKEYPLSEQDRILVLSELEVFACQAIFKQSELKLQIKDQIIAFANYFCAKKRHEDLLMSIVHSLKSYENFTCSLDLGRNLLELATFYEVKNDQNKAKEILSVLVQKIENCNRIFRLSFVKLLSISFEQKDFIQLERLLDIGIEFFQENEIGYPEYCLYQGIFYYYQKKFDEAQAYIKLSLKYPEILGMKMPLALQYLGYALLDYADIQKGLKQEILLEEAYNVFLLLFNNWSKVEGLLGCFYVKVRQESTLDWSFGFKLISDNLGKLSLFQKQLLFNLNLVSQFFPNFVIEKDVQTNNFYLLWTLVSKLSFDEKHNYKHLLKGASLSLEKIIVALLRHEGDKNLFGIETFIQRFLNERMKNFLDRYLHYSEKTSISWYISLLRDLYAKNFQFSEIVLQEYEKNCSSTQHDILACINALNLSFSQSKHKLLTFLEECITHNNSYAQDFLKLLFLDNASEKFLSKKRKEIFAWIENSYFSEEIFFKIFPLYNYIQGDKEAIDHLHKFISLFPNSQLMPVILYFLGIHQDDSNKAMYYFTMALEDYVDINPHRYNQNPFTYFFYKTKLELSILLIQRGERHCLIKAIEILEKMKEDFICLQHPLIKDFKEKYDTLKFELDIDYLLTYSFLKLEEYKELEQHLAVVLKKYTPFFDDPLVNRLLYFLWSLQKNLAIRSGDEDVCKSCKDIVFSFIRKLNEHDYLKEKDNRLEILPLYPLL